MSSEQNTDDGILIFILAYIRIIYYSLMCNLIVIIVIRISNFKYFKTDAVRNIGIRLPNSNNADKKFH